MPAQNLLKGKKIIITGASQGIGKALVLGLSKLGASIGLMSRSKENLEKLTSELLNQGINASFAVADVTDYFQIQEAFQQLNKQLMGIDVVINNAGFCHGMDLVRSSVAIDKIIDTNLKSILYSNIAVLPFISERKGASIINTSSIDGIIDVQSREFAFASASAAVNKISTMKVREFQQKGIRINAILPGLVNTEMLEKVPAQWVQMVQDYWDMRTLEPEELVPFYAFFASDESRNEQGRLVNIISLWKAISIVRNMPDDTSKEWIDIQSTLKEQLEIAHFDNVQENKRLLQFIIENFEVGEKKQPIQYIA